MVTKKIKFPFTLTNPTKILYPEDGITKEEIAEYYYHIQDWILPFVTHRPLTLVRCPDDYTKCFYQKHITHSKLDDIYGVMIKEKKSTSEYLYIKDTAGLLSLIQLGVLEIHPWGSHIENIEHPDIIIFDLDPSPELPWKKVVDAAQKVKKYLKEIKLKSFIKTTGGKGLHVVLPIKPKYNWDEIKNFSYNFVNFLVTTYSKEYVSNMSKEKRKGKIFIDYLRNQRGATAVAPYSTRARRYAPISTPLAWDELTDNYQDTFFTLKTINKRLDKIKKDPWKDFFKINQSLVLPE